MIDKLTNLVKRVFGDANERELKRIAPLVQKIAALEPSMKALNDDALRAKTDEFRARLAAGAALDSLLPEAFAVVREASIRFLKMRPYDCQMIGGIVLHQGKIAEMKTGEGKTLVATAPAYLNALTGKGVHVVTVNDYLAQRDADWMRPLYSGLGVSVGVILSGHRPEKEKRAAYASDITYGTNNEFGFDYLRDNMKYSFDDMVQRGHVFGIVDEVDSILIDEARTPLIISGEAQGSLDLYAISDAVIPSLRSAIDFVIDEKAKAVTLTEDGMQRVESKLGLDNLYDPANMEINHHIHQSLRAHHLYRRDGEYVVRDGKVIIVDEFTGRLMTGRRWSDGLHQAVEAKEKVNVERESQVYATITFQNLFRMYGRLSGMTGTAATEAAEFANIYNLDTVVIPTNQAVARTDRDDIIFRTMTEKFEAVTNEIVDCHGRGQPVLVGTTSVEKSELLSRELGKKGVPHEVLNAKNHHREALIVANAGRKGAVTISTNMAGRGTDIKLGGNPEALARLENPTAPTSELASLIERYESTCKAEADVVRGVGGLHILGTERHESRRVDNQLRGRSGRQGDPGSSRFYLSLEDDLLRIFGSDKITLWMERMGLKDDEPVENKWVTRSIENAQVKVEAQNFNMRKNLLEYDDVMNYQRKGVYDLRRRALASEGIRELVDDSVNGVVTDVMDDFVGEGVNPENWNTVSIRENLERVFGIVWEDADNKLRDLSREELRARLQRETSERVATTVDRMGEAMFVEVARYGLLQLTDSLWKDHLLALDRLRQGVSLRGYGQRNPLLEYKREALQMYLMMNAYRDEQLIAQLLRVEPDAAAAATPKPTRQQARRPDPAELQLTLPAVPEEAPVAAPARGAEAREFAALHGVRRNDLCPCGSGNKFKKCCAGAGEEAESAAG